MRSLLDINVLLAILDPDHVCHDKARQWWEPSQTDGWASCPLTQNGFVRIVSGRGYSNPFHIADAFAALSSQLADPAHEFWPDSISITDTKLFDHSQILGPKQITDIYLLGLAVANGGRFVNFDRGISLSAVHGAGPDHCVML